MAFHFNKETGKSGPCEATERNCPLGGTEEHFDTFAQAQAGYDSYMNAKSNPLAGHKAVPVYDGTGVAVDMFNTEVGEILRSADGELFIVTGITSADTVNRQLELQEVSTDGTLLEKASHVSFAANRLTNRAEFYENYSSEKKASSGTLEELAAKDAKLQELKQAYDRAAAKPRLHGDAMDEMINSNLDSLELEAKLEYAAHAAKLGYRGESQGSLDHTARHRPRYVRGDNARPLETGKQVIENAVYGQMTFNTLRPGEYPRTPEERGLKLVIMPNVKRLTDSKKLAFGKELWLQSDGSEEKWDNMTPAQRVRWADQHIRRTPVLNIDANGSTVDLKGTRSFSGSIPQESCSILQA